MKKFLLLFAIFVISACNAKEPIASEETSPSGLHFNLIQMVGGEDIAIQIAWPTDWAYRENTSKAVPFVGADLLVAGGASGYPAGQAGEKFADLKAEARLYASPDFVFGSLKLNKTSQAEVLKITKAHLVSPAFDQAWLTRLSDGLQKEVSENATKPQGQLFNTLRWAVFGKQALRNAISLDDPDTFVSIKLEELQKWHSEVFTNAPKAIVVAGALTPQEAGAMIDLLLKDLPNPKAAFNKTAAPNYKARRILLHTPASTTSQLVFIKPTPPTSKGNEWKDLLITSSLGGDDRSALFKAIRTELRASYSFNAGSDNYTQDLRVLYIAGEVETTKLAQTEKAVLSAYGEFLKTGPAGDLATLKTSFYDNIEKMKQSPDALAVSAAQAVLEGKSAQYVLNLSAELKAITADDVQAYLKTNYGNADDFVVIAVSPDANALPGACVIKTPQEAVNCP
jgi:zinc protease